MDQKLSGGKGKSCRGTVRGRQAWKPRAPGQYRLDRAGQREQVWQYVCLPYGRLFSASPGPLAALMVREVWAACIKPCQSPLSAPTLRGFVHQHEIVRTEQGRAREMANSLSPGCRRNGGGPSGGKQSHCGTLHRRGGGWKHARARAAGSLERCRVSHLPSNAPPLFFTCTRPFTVSRVCCLRRKARVQTPRSVAAAYSDSASASSLCVCSSA